MTATTPRLRRTAPPAALDFRLVRAALEGSDLAGGPQRPRGAVRRRQRTTAPQAVERGEAREPGLRARGGSRPRAAAARAPRPRRPGRPGVRRRRSPGRAPARRRRPARTSRAAGARLVQGLRGRHLDAVVAQGGVDEADGGAHARLGRGGEQAAPAQQRAARRPPRDQRDQRERPGPARRRLDHSAGEVAGSARVVDPRPAGEVRLRARIAAGLAGGSGGRLRRAGGRRRARRRRAAGGPGSGRTAPTRRRGSTPPPTRARRCAAPGTRPCAAGCPARSRPRPGRGSR